MDEATDSSSQVRDSLPDARGCAPASDRTPSNEVEPFVALIRAVASAARERADLSNALRNIGEWFLQLAGVPPIRPCEAPKGIKEVNEEPSAPATPAPEASREESRSFVPRQALPLTLGNAVADVPVSVPLGGPTIVALPSQTEARVGEEPAVRVPRIAEPPDLQLVTARCRVKVEACQWAAERRRRMAEGADFEQHVRPRHQEMIAKLKSLPNCYGWPLDPYIALPGNEVLETAERCYENLANIAELTHDIRRGTDDETHWEEAYCLLAEAQSALRMMTESLELKRDRDQEDAFHWLKHRTAEDGIHVPRFMRLQDRAEPSQWLDLETRINELRTRWSSRAERERRRRSLLNKARCHGRRLVAAAPSGGDHDWEKMVHALGELLEDGVPPSNVEIREIILPIVDHVPETFMEEPGFRAILTEIDKYLASREPDRLETATLPPVDDMVREAAGLLRNKVVVLIGGERRPHSKAQLEAGLGLSELVWIATRPHQSFMEFEPVIARPETELVMLAIRWSSHSFESVKDLCERHGKPYVRLPGGYGVQQVANQILIQASRKLRRA